jgi:pimeloyl-ACP methyl ester carboxylesterase
MAFWHMGVASPLSRLCRVTAYDLRGHGRSTMPASGYSVMQMQDDLERLLDHLGIEQAHLGAHSFGGTIALSFAVKHPDRVKSLVLADVRLRCIQPKQRLRDWGHWPQWQRMLARAGIELDENAPEGGYQMLVEMARLQLERPHLARHLPRLFSMGAGGGRHKGGVARRWLRLQETTSIQDDFTLDDSITRDELRKLEMPILAMYGEFSPTLPSAHALEELCPQTYLHIVKNAGHFFPLSKPKLMARAFNRFLTIQQDMRLTTLDDLQELDL